MLGAIIGDIVGSIYEFDNIKRKDFEFFGRGATFTDDSILTVATADWLLHGGEVSTYYARYVRAFPNPMGGYGGMFTGWVARVSAGMAAEPYNSCGNGSAMRVSPVGWCSDEESVVLSTARTSAACTHNHPEGIKGAQATAHAILLARGGHDAAAIGRAITAAYGYDLTMSVGELQRRYSWRGVDGTGDGAICQDSVPQAIICALQATGFEDAVRNAISIGGDSDTIGAITGAIAEPLYGIPRHIYTRALAALPRKLRDTVTAFDGRYGARINQ